MSEEQLGAALGAAIVASFGLWWFRLIMKNLRETNAVTRYGIYALIWLAYFVAMMLLITRSQTGS